MQDQIMVVWLELIFILIFVSREGTILCIIMAKTRDRAFDYF